MPRAKNVAAVPLETIWEVPDELWERLGPILERRYPRKAIGRPRADLRRVVNGVIFRLPRIRRPAKRARPPIARCNRRTSSL